MQSKLVKGPRFTDKIFEPYVMAIGQLALAWNDLHEKLGWLFATFLTPGELAPLLWNAPQFDRQKRALLEAATNAMPPLTQSDYPRLKEDILWLLKQVNSLEDARNTAIHSPLLAQSDRDVLVFGVTISIRSVAPNLWLQNSRAMKLAQKDLLTEFRWCRDAALLLRDYALSLDYATMPEDYPWPDRPSLPNRGQKKARSK